MKQNRLRATAAASLAAAGLLLGGIPARADVKLSGVFADHMVLQRDAKVPVWGTADAGEAVSVSVGDQKASTAAGADGNWRVELAGLKAGGPVTLEIAGKNKVTVNDVLVGDVWLCSGQSNMGFTLSWLKGSKYESDLTGANNDQLRQGKVPNKPSVKPLDDTAVAWQACTPQTAGEFTAAGYYFGQRLQHELHVPIGLLFAAWGGTSAESWTSKDALDTVPAFKERSDAQIANLAQLPEQVRSFPGAIAAWEKKYDRTDPGNAGEAKGWAAPDADTSDWKPSTLNAKWKQSGLPNGGIAWLRKEVTLPDSAAGKGFRLDLGGIDEEYETTYFNGEKLGESGHKPPQFYNGTSGYAVPGRLVKAGKNVLAIRFVTDTGDHAGIWRSPKAMGFATLGVPDIGADCLMKIEAAFPPLTPEALAARPACPQGDAPHTSSSLFGGMIHPLIPFAIKGCIWYQGEQDGSRGHVYRTLLPLMITDWRSRWGEGDFPFFIQQLPNWQAVQEQPSESGWAELREAQWLTAKSLPNCGLSVGIDIGDTMNVHPLNKREVGRRLSLAALAQTYGQKIEYSGPQYESMTHEGQTIRLTFTHAEGLKSADGGPLKTFAVAGEDRKFVWADAKIDGQTVVVSSPGVASPAAVRYAWADNPLGCNLTNASDLPAVPFRTDTFPGVSDNRK